MFRNEGEGNEVSSVGLEDDLSVLRFQSLAQPQTALTYLNISFCVSDGRSRIDIVFFSEPCARLGPAGEGEEVSVIVVMAVDLSLFELNGSNPIMSNVRSQTSSLSCFTRGVVLFRRDVFPGRAGMVSSLRAGATNCTFGWMVDPLSRAPARGVRHVWLG